MALLALALAGQGLCASASGRVQTLEQLRATLRRDSLVPCVFTKGDQARLYFTNAEQRVMFKADWDRTRLQTGGFSSHLATLKFDASPPPLPRPQDTWRELKVLAFDQWRSFARSALEGMVPSEAGHGLYLQFALGDTR